MKNIALLLPFLLMFSGCGLNWFDDANASGASTKETAEELAALTGRSVQLRKVALEKLHEKELAEVSMQKELAEIESKKQIEMGKMDLALKLKELELKKQQELAAMKLAAEQAEAERRYAEKRNLVLLAAFLIAVLAGGLFWLLKRRHDNKLRAYNDNLKKYFEEKERQDRMRLAEKIIDKIADGGTPSAQEQKLIEILRGVSEESPPQIEAYPHFGGKLPPQKGE